MKKFSWIFIFTIASLPALSQDSINVDSRKISYFFSVNTGFLGGERMKSLTYTFNTLHGITIGKRLRTGAGLGIDSYDGWQTLPLFGQVGYDLFQFNEGNALFVQIHYGWSHAWSIRTGGRLPYDDHGGKTYGAMVGYRMSVGTLKFYLSVGYKYQEILSTYTSPVYYDLRLYQPYIPYSQRSDQKLERFTATLGIGWH